MSSRSHHGCSRCKTRRQKCDEARPTCARCLQAGATCEYTVVLKWNGRTPRLPQHARRRRATNVSSTVQDSTSQNSVKAAAGLETAQHSDHVIQSLCCPVDPWSSLSGTSKHLLNHFVNKASLNAPHARIRDHVCGHVIPMIFSIPSLFHATMALAGLHYATLLRGVPAGFVVEEEVASHLSKSIGLLRHDLCERWDVAFLHDVLYTIRTLCVCEIYSGKADTSWRVHVNGAKAIIESALSRASSGGSERPSNWLTFQWYSSIEALTALTDRGLQNGRVDSSSELVADSILRRPASNARDYYFNIYTGYSSDLDPIFKEIGLIFVERQRSDSTKAIRMDANTIPEANFHQKALLLEQRVLSMMSRDNEHGLMLPLEVHLTVEELRQFQACNKAYQHSALIHIYRKIKMLSSLSREVQNCVQEIISAVSGILPVMELSPWVLLTTPLYTAGCEAIEADRGIIRHLLQRLYDTLRIRNTLRAISILEDRWSTSVHSVNFDKAHKDDTLDFIPY